LPEKVDKRRQRAPPLTVGEDRKLRKRQKKRAEMRPGDHGKLQFRKSLAEHLEERKCHDGITDTGSAEE